MNWLVIGGARSGQGAAKLLRKRGFAVRVSDHGTLNEKEFLTSIGVEVRDGGHDLTHLEGVDSVCISPGLPAKHLLVEAAKNKGLPVLSEIDLGLQGFEGQLATVTGTNGKSTVCAMLHHICQSLGQKSVIGGNFGDPLCQIVAEGRLTPILILELSSYQLDDSAPIHSDVAAITTFSQDHLARHGTMERYFSAKWKLFQSLKPGGLAIIPKSIQEIALKSGHTLPLSKIDFDPGDFEGIDALNAHMAAMMATHLIKRPIEECLAALKDYESLPFRLQPAGSLGKYPVINDSKSTNVESVAAAIASVKGPLVLIVGGQSKGESFKPLLKFGDRVVQTFVFGQATDEIATDLVEFKPKKFATLAELCSQLPQMDVQGTILFSPGCASFDEFSDYEERGRFFNTACSS